MSTEPELCDGDFSDLLETEGRGIEWPFLGSLVADASARLHLRNYEIELPSYAPALASRTRYTNALWPSLDLTATWNSAGATRYYAGLVNSYYLPAPDGSATVTQLVETAANSQHNVVSGAIAIAAGASQVVDVWLKSDGIRPEGQVVLYNGSDVLVVTYDLTTRSVNSNAFGAAGFTKAPTLAAGPAGWYRLRFAGTLNGSSTTCYLSIELSDGSTFSYPGSTAASIGIWNPQVIPGSDISVPCIVTTTAARSVDVTEIDSDDVFSHLVGESKPDSLAGDLVRVSRVYARIPTPQTAPYKKLISRPVMHGIKSGTAYAVSFDAAQLYSHVFTARKAVTAVATIASSTVAAALPSSNIHFVDSGAHTCDVAANSAAASAVSALGAALTSIVGFSGNSATGTLNLSWSGPGYMASITAPSGVNMVWPGYNYVNFYSTGTTTIPGTTNITAAAHGAVIGDRVAFWNSDALLGTGIVIGVTDADHFSVRIADLNGADSLITHCAFSSDAAACYVNGAKEVDVEDITTFYRLGFSLKAATGGTIATISDIPRQTAQMDAISWLAALIASATTAIETSAGTKQWMGPIIGYTYTRILMSTAVDTVTP